MARDVTRMTTPRLGAIFLRVGALAFGGLGATVALIERELVDRHNALTRDDIAAALTHTKLLPGSTVVQIVAYLGWRLGGWAGQPSRPSVSFFPRRCSCLRLRMDTPRWQQPPAPSPRVVECWRS